MLNKLLELFNWNSFESLTSREVFSLEDISLIDVQIAQNEYEIPKFIKYTFQYKNNKFVIGEIISFIPEFIYGSVYYLEAPKKNPTCGDKNFFYEHLTNQVHLAKLDFPDNLINNPRLLLESFQTEKDFYLTKLGLL